MSEHGVTPQGFVPKRLDEIAADIHVYLSKEWGVDTTLNPESLLNVLVTGISDEIAALWEAGQSAYLALYPSSAEDLSLDNAVQFGGIRRIGDQPTYYPIHCTGKDGTVIKAGTILASTTNPEARFVAAADKAIVRSDFNRAQIRIAALQSNAIYTVGINGDLYSVTSGAAPTAAGILDALRAAIPPGDYTARLDGELLCIEDNNRQRGNALILSENLTPESVTTIVNFASEDYGKVVLPDGTITKIVTNINGLLSCTNRIPPIYGRRRQTNAELRQSYIERIAVRSDRMTDSLESAILDNVQGIVKVKAYENDSNVWDAEGRPPHSVEVVADGGSEIAIAREILKKKAGGIQTWGNVAVEVPLSNGEMFPIRFNRPQYVYVWLRITLTVDAYNALPPNYADLAKQAVVETGESLGVGEAVYIQRFIGEVYRRVTGMGYVDIEVFSTTDGGVAPDEYRRENIKVTVRQKAVIEEKRIEVTLRNG